LIDFDVEITDDPADYRNGGSSAYIPALEHIMTPEVALFLLNMGPGSGSKEQLEYSVSDVRTEPLWRLGVIMFELLHGYAPWDSPNFSVPDLVFSNRNLDEEELTRHIAYRDDRRRRMVNDPVQISERIPMTQECVDALRAMLANDPADRPSIEELVAFPWFQGSYIDSGDESIRPER